MFPTFPRKLTHWSYIINNYSFSFYGYYLQMKYHFKMRHYWFWLLGHPDFKPKALFLPSGHYIDLHNNLQRVWFSDPSLQVKGKSVVQPIFSFKDSLSLVPKSYIWQIIYWVACFYFIIHLWKFLCIFIDHSASILVWYWNMFGLQVVLISKSLAASLS